MPMPSDMYGAVSDRSGSDGAEEPIAEYIAKAYYVTHSLQTMRFFIAQIRSAGYICLYGFLLAGGDGVDSNSRSSYDGILFSGGRSVIISTATPILPLIPRRVTVTRAALCAPSAGAAV